MYACSANRLVKQIIKRVISSTAGYEHDNATSSVPCMRWWRYRDLTPCLDTRIPDRILENNQFCGHHDLPTSLSLTSVRNLKYRVNWKNINTRVEFRYIIEAVGSLQFTMLSRWILTKLMNKCYQVMSMLLFPFSTTHHFPKSDGFMLHIPFIFLYSIYKSTNIFYDFYFYLYFMICVSICILLYVFYLWFMICIWICILWFVFVFVF
jgi:hypothetical protein